MKKIKLFAILLMLSFLIIGCGKSNTELLLKAVLISGGDAEEPMTYDPQKKVVTNVSEGDCGVFYKGKASTEYIFLRSETADIPIFQAQKITLGDVQKSKKPLILFLKRATWSKDLTDDLNKNGISSEKLSSNPEAHVYFEYELRNITTAEVEDMIIVDALPQGYTPIHCEFFKGFNHENRPIKEDYDKLVYDLKKFDGNWYAVFKVEMVKNPMKKGETIQFRVVGNVDPSKAKTLTSKDTTKKSKPATTKKDNKPVNTKVKVLKK